MFRKLLFSSILMLITLPAFSAEIASIPTNFVPYVKEGVTMPGPGDILFVDPSVGDVKVPGFVPAPDKNDLLRGIVSSSTNTTLYTGVNKKTKAVVVYGFGVKPDYNANFNKVTISSPRGGNDSGGNGGGDGGGY